MLAAVLLCAATAGAAVTNPYLREGQQLYDEFEFHRCVDRLLQAQRLETAPAELAQIEMYLGLCRYNLGQVVPATQHLRLALRLAPDLALPPMTSPKLVQLLASVRSELERQALEKKAPAEPLEPKASTPATLPLPAPAPPPPELLVLEPRAPARTARPLPWFLAGAGVASAGAATLFGLQARRLEAAANHAEYDLDNFRLAGAARANATAANVGLLLTGVLVTGAGLSYFAGAP